MKKGIAAGMSVALASCLYSNMENKVAAAILFSFALVYVCMLGLDLFTGKIGWALDGKQPWTWYVRILFLNFAGVLCICLPASVAIPSIAQGAAAIMEAKCALSLPSLLVRGIFCGMLMSLAVMGYRKETGLAKYLGIFLCIPLFILAGFDHSIADASYLVLAGAWHFLPGLAAVTAGNTIGSLFAVWLVEGK